MIRVSNKGLSDLEKFFQRAPEAATMAARMAINDTATRQGMTLIRKEMMDDVAFPRGYLAGGHFVPRYNLAAVAWLEHG